MDELLSSLRGSFYQQTSVYVVFSQREKKIHVISVDIHAKYSVARNQLLFPTNIPDDLRRYFEELVNNNSVHGGDKSGFYNGLGSSQIGLWDLVCERGDGHIHSRLDLCSPYKQYPLPNDLARRIVGEFPVIQQRNVGPLRVKGFGPKTITISMNDDVLDYLICKIDQDCCFCERVFDSGYIFGEQLMSANWEEGDRERIRSNAVELVKLLADPESQQHIPEYERLPTGLAACIMSSTETGTGASWPITTHPHIVRN